MINTVALGGCPEICMRVCLILPKLRGNFVSVVPPPISDFLSSAYRRRATRRVQPARGPNPGTEFKHVKAKDGRDMAPGTVESPVPLSELHHHTHTFKGDVRVFVRAPN